MIKCEHCGAEHEMRLRICPSTGQLIAPERFYPPGMVLDGKYRLGKLLGAGGMGAVIEATHLMLGRTVAIKLLLPDYADNPEMTARLTREARAASATGHRNITAVTDMGKTREGTLYIVMERLTGRSLETILKTEAPLPISRAASLISEVLAGLEAVHQRAIIHRDLKPSNVMVATGDDGAEIVKILDFGISKVLDERASDLTTIGKIMGTPRYMSPEQARGVSDLDHRADLYACGAIFYTMLTATPPYRANNYNALMAAILEGELELPSKRRQGIPAEVDAIVRRALAVKREHRFPDAASFRRALRPLIEPLAGGTQLGVGPPPALAAPTVSEIELAPEGAPLDPRTQAASAPTLGVSSLTPAPARRARPSSGPAPAPQPASTDRLELEPLAGLASSTPFAPSQDDRPLELAEAPQRPAPAPPPPPPPRPFPWRPLLGGAILLGVAAVGWTFRAELTSLVTGTPTAEAVVYILLETDPADAEVSVDGVVQVSKPIALPRSESRLYQVRVRAPGHLTETRELIPDRTRAIQIKLKPKPKRR